MTFDAWCFIDSLSLSQSVSYDDHWRDCGKLCWSCQVIVFFFSTQLRIVEFVYVLLRIESRHPLWVVVIIHLVRSLVNLVNVWYLRWLQPLPLTIWAFSRTAEKKRIIQTNSRAFNSILQFYISIWHLYYISTAWIEFNSI